MTGRYQVRSGIYPDVLFPDNIGGENLTLNPPLLSSPCHPGLPHQEVTLAELVKSVGYSTAHLGKWHLGVGESLQYLPTTQGFDYYLVR